MTPDRWSAVKKVLQSALDRPAAERSGVIAELCAGDDRLRAEVEGLLEAHVDAGDFLEHSPAAPSSMIGTTVGSYRILEMLGAGGMGEVYLALDTRLGRRVALKFLSSEFTSNAERVRRFRQEAQVASGLNHPNILTIHELGEHNGIQFIASELVEGETLRARLARGPMEPSEVVHVATQIASALRSAHAAGVVHRDIKPENIMLRPDGYVKVLDFGLAKLSESSAPVAADQPTALHTAAGVVMGTTQYMSPEQLRGHVVDARSDQWSLGVVLYEMLSGRRPFEGSTGSDVIAAILEREHPPLEAPDELRRITTRLLRKKREERYPETSDLYSDLVSFQKPAWPRTSGAGIVARSPKRKRAAAIIGIIAVAAAVAGASWHFRDRGRTATVSAVDSIAVLPFSNSSNDPSAEYFSDGITESIINSLSQLPQLKVMSRSTVFRFKGQNIDVQKIGRLLDVRAVVTGRVSQIGERLTVAAELVATADGRQLWGEQYRRQLSDVFDIQEEISKDISEKLRIKISGEEQQRLTKRYTNDPEAYQLYLKGRYYWNKRTGSNLQRAVTFFNQAIEKDPNYALAYVGLADSYALLPEYAGLAPSEWYQKARAAALRALEIDDSVAEAHATLALIEGNLRNHAAADRLFRRAIQLKPNYATAYHWYSLHLRRFHRLDEALAAIRKARELDPLSPVINLNVALEHYSRGEHQRAMKEYESVIDLDPNFAYAYVYLGRVHAALGRCSEALDLLRTGVERTERAGQAVAFLGYAQARCGNRAEARKLVAELEQRVRQSRGSAFHVAIVYVGLGDVDKTFAQLEAAHTAGEGDLADISAEPELRTIRSDPRYRDLTRRLGVPP